MQAINEETSQQQNIPVACNLAAFNAAQQKRHSELLQRLKDSVQEVTDLPEGFAYHFISETQICQEVMEFALLERRCCPFFTFRMELLPQEGPLILSLTGPEGAKDILRNFLRS